MESSLPRIYWQGTWADRDHDGDFDLTASCDTLHGFEFLGGIVSGWEWGLRENCVPGYFENRGNGRGFHTLR